MIRRSDNQLNNNIESDGRRNGIININAHLKSEDGLDRQQQLETIWFILFFVRTYNISKLFGLFTLVESFIKKKFNFAQRFP